jgi:hypothetical protein
MLVSVFGMQLHAAVTLDGRDRKRLECRYLLRPAFAHDAVRRTDDGQVRVDFKKPNKHGVTYAQMSPDSFLARLCALVPPPGSHTILYYGVLASRHALRARVVPKPDSEPPEPKQLLLFVPRGQLELPAIGKSMLDQQPRDAAPRRLSWMKLSSRVFKAPRATSNRQPVRAARGGPPARVISIAAP